MTNDAMLEQITQNLLLDWGKDQSGNSPGRWQDIAIAAMDAAREDEAGKWEAQLKAERERAEYWSKRCLAAENCLDKSPCDPDITKAQIEAHRNWEAAKKNEYNNKP